MKLEHLGGDLVERAKTVYVATNANEPLPLARAERETFRFQSICADAMDARCVSSLWPYVLVLALRFTVRRPESEVMPAELDRSLNI